MFFGHTRFSLFDPDSTSWRASNGSRFTSVDAYRDYLFSDDRLRPRIDIFVKLSLPQIAIAADGHTVRHIVSFPSVLPEPYKQQLADAAARYSFLTLDEQVDGKATTNPYDLAAASAEEAPFGVYRLDDDDLLPSDYFRQVAPFVTTVNAGMVVSLGRGITALYDGGRFYNLRHSYAPMHSIGLMNICRYDNGDLIRPTGTAHNVSDRHNPLILDSRRIGFLMTRHVSQDTSLGWGTPDREDMIDVLLRNMDKHPPVEDRRIADDAFPAAKTVLTDRERPGLGRRQEFLNAVSLTKDEVSLAVEPFAGTFILNAEIDCPNGRGANNVLVSFNLQDESGNHLDPETDASIAAASGLSVSTDSTIGFFCYLQVSAGRHRVRQNVRLPSGVSVTGTTLRRFRDHSLDISVNNISIDEIRPISSGVRGDTEVSV